MNVERRRMAVTQADRVAVAERDRMRRLFNRLEAAITHHLQATPVEMHSDADEALYKARDKVLNDYREGNG